jgi:ABC-type spermidine/putrescine transport system permease subunit I
MTSAISLRRFTHGLLMLPALSITIALFLLALLPTLLYSFYTFVPPASMHPALTLDSYAAFAHPVYFGHILLTARISVISTILAIILGYP